MIWTLTLSKGGHEFIVFVSNAPDMATAVRKATELVKDAEIPEDDENFDEVPYILTYECLTH